MVDRGENAESATGSIGHPLPNQGWIYRDRVPTWAAGQTVLEYYVQRYRHSSLAEWSARIEAGLVRVQGQPTTPRAKLLAGQQLAYHRPPWVEPVVPLNIQVRHEDADLLVIDKPAGLPVLPGAGFVQHTLLGQLQQRYPHDTPAPIHRLGRGTSGLVLLGRSPLAKANLSQQLRQHQMSKLYRALIGPCDLPDRFTITQAIGKRPHPALGYVYGAVPNDDPGALSARSEGRVVQRGGDLTLLEITILTGRPHQIRIHLAAIGYPLLGDPLYQVGGIPYPWSDSNPAELPLEPASHHPVPGDCGYHLHAYQLGFIHPRTGESIRITSPPPLALESRDAQSGEKSSM
jgi:23S rRNA pseudouridine1911/1915/1917 synthase